MLEELYERPSRWRVFWPDVSDLSGAHDAIHFSSWVVFISAGIGVALSVWSALVSRSLGLGLGGLIGSGVLALLGLGVRRGWRTAAVAGLLLMGIGVIVAIARGSLPGVMDLFTIIAFVGGVRGTFAQARLRRLGAVSKAEGTAG